MKRLVSVNVNGEKYSGYASTGDSLLRFLREELHLVGTKEGCGAGECGACTVIMNGKAVNACLVLAVEVEGAEIRTIEGEAVEGKLSDLQQKFVDLGAVQCGFCTPGMVMAARALLDENPHPNREEIIDAMEGNLCRCTGYEAIIDAVEKTGGGKVD